MRIKILAALLTSVITVGSLVLSIYSLIPSIAWEAAALVSFVVFAIIMGKGWYEASQKQYVETSHKQKLREFSEALIDNLHLPYIQDCFIEKLTLNTVYFPKSSIHRFNATLRTNEQKEIEFLFFEPSAEDSMLYKEALYSHLKTGGFKKLLPSIKRWQKEISDNLQKCQGLVNSVSKDLEESYELSIPGLDSKCGLTTHFLIDICAVAVEKAKNNNIYDKLQYEYEDSRLKLRSHTIYISSDSQISKEYEQIHRTLINRYTKRDLTIQIAKQQMELSSVAETIRQKLHMFNNMEHIPGRCKLCT